MVQLKSKGSQKRSAETSSTSPLLKKRRVLPDVPQKSATNDDQKSSKVSKKLSKVSQKMSAGAPKIPSTSPQKKKKQVLSDAPLKSDITAGGHKGSKVYKKLTKGSQKRSAETSSTSPHLKKRRVLPDPPQKSCTVDDDQNDVKVPKKLTKGSRDKKCANKALQVYINRIPKEVGKKDLRELFCRFGSIRDISLPNKMGDWSAHRGFAFIEFADERAREEALAAGQLEVNGQFISIWNPKSSESVPKEETNHALEVFVGQIPQEVNREDLKEHFSQFGSIKHITLPAKPEDRSAHKGFAFVEFIDKCAKKKALAADQHKVRGQIVTLRDPTPSKPDPKKEMDPALKVFIKNIPEEVSKEELRENFSAFGAIKNINLPVKAGDLTANKGFAFIEFADLYAKKRALAIGELEVNGQVVSILIPAPKEGTNHALEVFVGQIPQEVDREDLKEHFSHFGSVKHVTLPTQPEDRSVHKGFAFVEFADKHAKEKALAADQHEVKGNVVSVRDSGPMESAPKKEVNYAFQVFVSQIPQELGKEHLKEHFSQFGNIKDISLPSNGKEQFAHRGYAFIEFADELAKEEALAADQHEVNGHVVSACACEAPNNRSVHENKTSQLTTGQKLAPKAKKNHALEVFVGKIPQEVSREELKEHFSQFGSVASVTLPTKPEDRSAHRGFAFVEFADEFAREEALAADQHEVNGRVVSVRISESPSSRDVEHNKPSQLPVAGEWVPNSLVASGLPPSTTAQTLSLHFSHYGKVVQARMVRAQGKRNSAVIVFEDAAGVNAALQEEHEIDYSSINVKKANLSDFSLDGQKSFNESRNGELEESDEEMEQGSDDENEDEDEGDDEDENEDDDENEDEDENEDDDDDEENEDDDEEDEESEDSDEET